MKCWTNLFLLVLVLLLSSCLDKSDPNEQINKEIKAIDDYLKNNNTDYIGYDATGTRIVIKEVGNDAPPHEGQTVSVTYTAKVFSSGTVFDSGVINDKVENITIQGLQRGILSILKGTHAVLYIPSKYAFGSTGRTGVPANSTVVYDITLNQVTRTSEEQIQFQLDTATIHDYIKFPGNNVTGAIMHPSGIWYTIDVVGSGIAPKIYDKVSFQYKGRIMPNTATFDEGSVSLQSVFAFIDGLKIGFPLMKEGGSAKFYIPSGYGYGTAGVNGVVGANANLIFEVTLNDVSTQ